MGCSPAKSTSVSVSSSSVSEKNDRQKISIVSKTDKLAAWHRLAKDLEFTDDEDDTLIIKKHPEKVELAGSLSNPSIDASGSPYITPISTLNPPCDKCKEIFQLMSIKKNTELMIMAPKTVYFFKDGDCVSMKRPDSS